MPRHKSTYAVCAGVCTPLLYMTTAMSDKLTAFVLGAAVGLLILGIFRTYVLKIGDDS
jgi:hypothetical protein